jgi:3-hydroxyacyl-[acyl-carrier-protein] dehydratase
VRDDIRDAVTDLELSATGASARFRFAQDLSVFQGHFPGYPIVPGVYLIEGARVLGERFLGERLAIASVVSAKFSATVLPEDWVEASAVLDAEREPITCDALFRCRGVDAARIRLRLTRTTPRRTG